MQAGGRIGEWFAGTYAAVAAAASVRARRAAPVRASPSTSRSIEAMVIAMGSLGAVSAQRARRRPDAGQAQPRAAVDRADRRWAGRVLHHHRAAVPGLPGADRPPGPDRRRRPGVDRRPDAGGATSSSRMVHDWAADKTTDEIIELATGFPHSRRPDRYAADRSRPSTTSSSAASSSTSEDGAVAPRVPYRSDAICRARPGRRAGAGRRHRPGDVATRDRDPAAARETPRRCRLTGVRVVDFTAFWAGPLATQVLAALGADVIKVEGVRRPDGMRFAGGRPPSWDLMVGVGPGLPVQQHQQARHHPRTRHAAGACRRRWISIAHGDLVIENFSPRVMANFGLEWDVVHAANPTATMVRMPAFGLDGPWRDRVGFAQTMEQASGMAWMTGPADGPPLIPRGACDPLAGLHAAFAAIAALRDPRPHRRRPACRVDDGRGGAEHRRRGGARVFAQRRRAAPRRQPRTRCQPPGRLSGARATTNGSRIAVLDDDTWPALGRADRAHRAGGRPHAARRAGSTPPSRRDRQAHRRLDVAAERARRGHTTAGARHRRCPGRTPPPNCSTTSSSPHGASGRSSTIPSPDASRPPACRSPSRAAPRRWITTPAPMYGQHTAKC